MRTIYGSLGIVRDDEYSNPVLIIRHDGNDIPLGMTLKDTALPTDDPMNLVDVESATGRVFFREADGENQDDNPDTRIIVPAGTKMAKDAPFYSVRKTDNTSFIIVDFHGDKEVQHYAVFVTDITSGVLVWDFRTGMVRQFPHEEEYDLFATKTGLKPIHRWNGKEYVELEDVMTQLTLPDDSEII